MTKAIDVSPILQINNKKHLCRFKNWEISRLAFPAAARETEKWSSMYAGI